jgi:hypothetical protein
MTLGDSQICGDGAATSTPPAGRHAANFWAQQLKDAPQALDLMLDGVMVQLCIFIYDFMRVNVRVRR